MPRIMYVDKRFGMDALAAIDHANRICRQYRDQGYDLTLRQRVDQFLHRFRYRLRQYRWRRSPAGRGR